MQSRLVRPRTLDEGRVGNLIDALEASVARRAPAAVESKVPSSEKLTYFHSRLLPKPSVRALVRAIVKARIAFDWTTAAIAVSLTERYRRTHSLTPHMLHRIMIGALLIAAKAHQDVIPTNKLVAKTVGVSRTELARIEKLLCEELEWRVNVTHNDLVLDEVELCGNSIQVDSQPTSTILPELTSPTSIASQSAAATRRPSSNFERSNEFVATF